MKRLLYLIFSMIILSSCLNTDKPSIKSKTKSNYQGPPMFVLTEMNGRELEEKAYFTIKYDNTFELKIGDGTIYKYTPTKHFGSDPLCNILATDDLGRNTAICIKKLEGKNAIIMLESEDMISNFKGYAK